MKHKLIMNFIQCYVTKSIIFLINFNYILVNIVNQNIRSLLVPNYIILHFNNLFLINIAMRKNIVRLREINYLKELIFKNIFHY
jgi:hypothetical protein